MSKKIHLHDEVIVITGKYKGQKGKVIGILSNFKVIVKGVNLVKKHQKPIPNSNESGGIQEKESSIHVSNLAIFNKHTNKADKVKFKIENKKKVRIFKSNEKYIES